jgi:hypothetical protein
MTVGLLAADATRGADPADEFANPRPDRFSIGVETGRVARHQFVSDDHSGLKATREVLVQARP